MHGGTRGVRDTDRECSSYSDDENNNELEDLVPDYDVGSVGERHV